MKMSRISHVGLPILVACIFAFSGVLGLAQEDAAKLKKSKVLLVTGANNHDWPHTSKHIKNFLQKTEKFDVTITEKPGEFLAKEDLTKFDVIYLDYNGPRWGKPAEDAFLKAVQGGVGVTVMHAANNAFLGWKEYEALSVYCWRKGTGHGQFHTFDVDVVDHNHPITRDMPPIRNHPDELYHKLVHMHRAKFRLLMTAESSTESGGSGRPEPMVIVTNVGKGRIFHTPLGHVWPNQPKTRASLEDPQLQLLIARGTEWAATGDCTLEADDFGLPHYGGTMAKRPVKTWVRRCVLDGRARMIVAQLDQCLSVAFDAKTCNLYRVWGGTLKLVGTVFDGVHGPQPKTMGKPYAQEIKLDQPRKYLGYRIKDGQLTFRYRLKSNPNSLIEETIEHVKPGRPLLERKFVISGLKEGEKVKVAICRFNEVEYYSVSPSGHAPKAPKDQTKPVIAEFGNGTFTTRFSYRMGQGVKK